MEQPYLTASTLLCLALIGSGCTQNEAELISEVVNGPRAVRDLATAAMPANQSKLLIQFKDSCKSYLNQQNDIQKSQVFRDAAKFYTEVGPIKEWAGTLRRMVTDQGGSTARLTILMGDSTISDMDVRLGTEVYKAAGKLTVGQNVVFSGRALTDYNTTEVGKVCNPDFTIKLTALGPLP